MRLRLLLQPNSRAAQLTSVPVRRRTTATKNKTKRKFLFTSLRVSNLILPLTKYLQLMKVKLLPKKSFLKRRSKLPSRRTLF